MRITRKDTTKKMLTGLEATSLALAANGLPDARLGFPHPNNKQMQNGLPDTAHGGFMVLKGFGYGPARSANDVCTSVAFEVRVCSSMFSVLKRTMVCIINCIVSLLNCIN
jgi:hypothetical protein